MQIRIVEDTPAETRTGALVVPVFSGATLDGAAAQADSACGGEIGEALQSGEIKGKLGEVVLVHAKDRPFRRVLAVGLGESAAFEPAVLAKYAGTAVRFL